MRDHPASDVYVKSVSIGEDPIRDDGLKMVNEDEGVASRREVGVEDPVYPGLEGDG